MQIKYVRVYSAMIRFFESRLIYARAATATKASKAQALPKFWVTVNTISTRGADYAHHSTMGLVWLKFAVAPLPLERTPRLTLLRMCKLL